LAADQLGDRVIGGGDGILSLGGGLVSADLRLSPQVRGHGVQRRLRQQRRAGVVEVNAPGAARRLRPRSAPMSIRMLTYLEAKGCPGRPGLTNPNTEYGS
jgi:hypothetical protein